MTRRFKTSLKLIITLALMMFAILVFNGNQVSAVTDTEKETITNVLNTLPDSMKLDIKESEYKKADDEILSKTDLKAKLKDAGISDVRIDCGVFDYMFYDDFYKATISISQKGKELARKSISLTYSNSEKRSSADEQYIRNINLKSPKYYEVDLFNIQKDGYNVLDMAKKYYQNKINNNDITVLTTSGAGDGSPLQSYVHGTTILIFKDDILYDLRHMGDEETVPLITVPSDVPDIEEYAITQLNEFFDVYDNGNGDKVTKLEKGSTYLDSPNVYTVYYDWKGFSEKNEVIIRKETKPSAVTNTDTKTNIKLDTTTEVVPAGTTLVAEKVTSGNNYNTVVTALGNDVSKFEMFDISLMNNNAKVQPTGKVKVSIPVPTGYDTSKIVVYRVADDGTKTKYDTTINNGFIVFETDHFSNYVVAEQSKATETPKQEETKTDTTPTNTTDRKLDNTPKTGEENVTSIITAVISLLSVVGIAVVKRF